MGKRSHSQSSKAPEKGKRNKAIASSQAEHPGYAPQSANMRSKKTNKSDTTKDVVGQVTMATTINSTNKTADSFIKEEDENDDIVWDDDPDIQQTAKTSTNDCLRTEPDDGVDLYDIEIDDTDDTLIGTDNVIDKGKFEAGANDEQDAFDIKLTEEFPKKVTAANESQNANKMQEAEEKRFQELEETEKKLTEAEQVAKEKEIRSRAAHNAQKLLVGNFETCALMNVENMPLLKKGLFMSTVGDMELGQVNVAGVKLEITVKVLGFETNGLEVDNDTGELIVPTTEAPPKLTVDTAKSNASESKNLGEQGPLNAPATYSVTPGTSRPACRFGDKCNKRDTCQFDHSSAVAVKKICSFVNTITGCAQGDNCIFSHAQEGRMCKKSQYRQRCPNGSNCGFKHEDDKSISLDENLYAGGSEPTTTPIPPARERSRSAAVEIAERAAQEAVTPPADAPIDPRKSVQHAGQKRG
jgi:hypothetical protein